MEDRIDARIYGFDGFSTAPIYGGAGVQAVPTSSQVDQVSVLTGSNDAQIGAGTLAANNRERATALESFGAGVSTWTTSDLVRRWNRPDFTPEPSFDSKAANKAVPFALTSEQYMELRNTQSPAEHQYWVDNMERVNTARTASGDNPIVSGIATLADPVWFGIDAVTLGAGKAARLVRAERAVGSVVQGAVGAGSAFALGKAAQQEGMSDEAEVWLGAMLMGSIGAATYKPGVRGSMVPKDHMFPSTELKRVADDFAEVHMPTGHAQTAPVRTVQAPHEVPTVAYHNTGNVLADMVNHPNVHVVETAADAGAAIPSVKSGAITIEKDAKAAFVPDGNGGGTVVLVRENIKVGDDVKGILLHEVGVHMNAERVLGTTVFNSMLQELGDLASKGSKRARQAFSDVPVGTSAELRNEEALGYYIERNHKDFKDTFMSRFVTAARSKLREMGVVNVGVSERDIVNLVRKAAKAPSAIRVTTTKSGAVRYSKGLGVTTQQQAAKTVAQKFAGALELSLHKTLSKYSKRGNEIADILVADPLDKSGNSVASIRRSVRADMSRPQYVYEDLLAKAMSAKGASTAKRILNSAESTRIQRGIEKDVYMELLRRNRLALDGMPVNSAGIDPVIAKMADAHEVATDLALAERKRAGVLGADAVQESRGYVTRRWDNSKIEGIQAELEATGMAPAAARQVLVDNVSIGIQRANGWDAELAGDVAKAILDRSRSQGYFEDTVLRKHSGQDALAEVRNLLTGTGLSESRMQRVLDVLAGKADEGGKNATLKHRVDISMDEAITLPNGERRAISDMLDTGIATHLERYLDGAAADVAFARKGLTERSAVSNLRKELAHSIGDVTKRQEAVEMFDNTVSAIRGEPTGEKMHEYMRNSAAITQMVSLGASALWQATEYATIMMHYGAGRTMAAAFKELPIIRNILGDKLESTHLREVLSSNAAQDMRIRPFINRMEDGFEIAPSAQVQLALQQAKQLVPYINGMKYIQSHQARLTGNLIVNTLQRAAKGDAKAAKALEAYGLESHVLAAVSHDIASAGMDTAKWSKATWEAVRTPLTKMVDESVLRANTGEIPAFAQFSQVGKFLFTFRGFVLAAHNKVLSSTLHNQGFAGLGLTMLYQFPLTIMATAANNTISGKKEMTEDQLLKASFSQMGSLGLLSELAGVALGNKQQFGSPGTIAIDKAYKLGGAVASGDLGNIGAATLNTIPLLSTFLPMKAIGESLKGN